MFFETVYAIVKKIPRGKVATYGQIAKIMGAPKKAREVGWALHANKRCGEVPCHRVVDRAGNLAKGFAFGGEEAQKQMLKNEGVEVVDNRVDIKRYIWNEKI